MGKPTTWMAPPDCESAHCIEVRRNTLGSVVIRNNTEPMHMVIGKPEEFAAFLAAAKAGAYDFLLEQ